MGRFPKKIKNSYHINPEILGIYPKNMKTLVSTYALLRSLITIAKVWKQLRVKVLVAQSCPTLETPWTVACQAPLPMGFSSQEYWSGLPLPFPSPGDLPDPGIEPESLPGKHVTI